VTPRVLFIGAFPPAGSPIRGGIVTSCTLLLQSSFARQFDLVLLDTTQRSIPEPPVAIRAVLALGRVLRFVAILERRRPQAVLAFTSQGASFVEKGLCAAYARLRGVPTVLLMRGGPFMDDVRGSAGYRRFARLLLRQAAVIPCQGAMWQCFFRDELGLDPAGLPIVHNWTARADYLAVVRPPVRERQPLQVLFLAWVDASKGVFELVDAAITLWADDAIPAFELHVAGGGAHIERLRARVRDEGLEGRVILHGWVGDDARLALYTSADIFVLPSHAEGMPNSMIEAMSLGVPVVVTPVGSVPDVLRDGDNGLLVPVRDVHALRAALARLLMDPELRQRIGAAGHRTAAEVFSLERGATALAAAVRLAIGTPSESDAAVR
jgi:glycosyltransferase involved in cell wall biosynthesis